MATAAVRRHCGETEACSLGEKEHNCRVVGTRSKEEGIVAGGGVALLQAGAAVFKRLTGLTGDEATGAKIVDDMQAAWDALPPLS